MHTLTTKEADEVRSLAKTYQESCRVYVGEDGLRHIAFAADTVPPDCKVIFTADRRGLNPGLT